MKHILFKAIFFGAIVECIIGFHFLAMAAENIDPLDDDSQYAYGENVGWLNAEPSDHGGPGVEVANLKLTGYLWGENIGWVSLSCVNTSSCDTVNYGVTNDRRGNLSGYAWSENAGWVSFSCENTASCDTVEYGVKISPTAGDFNGYAWCENIGWAEFNGTDTILSGVNTSWRGIFAMPWLMLLFDGR